jgi:hypothetical protein
MAKVCFGKHTIGTILHESDNLDELDQALNGFPGMYVGRGDDEAKAKIDAKNKARQAADIFCGKRHCDEGECHQGNFGFRTLASEKGALEHIVIIDVTWVRCKCV